MKFLGNSSVNDQIIISPRTNFYKKDSCTNRVTELENKIFLCEFVLYFGCWSNKTIILDKN